MPLLGPRIAAEALFDDDRHDEGDLALLELVRAHSVLPLLGKRLRATSAADIQAAVAQLLAREVPGFDWLVPDDWAGLFERYGIVHASLAAPPRPETGEPMALELFGEADSADAVVIKTATYSNLMFAGYNVPVYL